MKANQAEFKTRKLIRKQNKSISTGKIMITCLIPAYIQKNMPDSFGRNNMKIELDSSFIR